MLDRFCLIVDVLSRLLIRGSDIMQYPVWARRIILLTSPISLPLIASAAAIGACLVYFSAMLLSIYEEVTSEGVGSLFHARSLSDLLAKR